MSLFSAREWWTAPRSDEPEEYDTQSMVVANFGQSGGDDVVVTGSLSGVRLPIGPCPAAREPPAAPPPSPAPSPTHTLHPPRRCCASLRLLQVALPLPARSRCCWRRA